MKLPKLTTKQEQILQLLYKYRYLDRIQIQKALKHKDKRRVLAWLKDLREKQYIEWIYSTDFIEKTKPAIYYLGINGIRYLKSLDKYPIEEIRKRYKEDNRSRTFIDRSLLIADCALTLKTVGSGYGCIVEADYIDPAHEYHFLAEHDILRPSLYIQKQTKQQEVTTSYLLELFDATLPRYRMRRRLKAYVTYLEDGEWEGGDPQPVILLVCPNITELIYAKRATKKLIEDSYEEDMHILFTTTEILKNESITAKIWEDGRLRYGL